LDRLDAREVNRVRVHPADAPMIEQSLSRGGAFRKVVEVVPDPTLERGAAIFETVRGQFDASVDTQLQEIERGFADVNPQ
jgi:flagellar assembly protein FliH